MKQETKEKMILVGIGSIGVASIAVCSYFGYKNKNQFAKYVMQHPEEYKLYQDVEKMKRLEDSVSRLESTNKILSANNTKLSKKNEELTKRLKEFVQKEYSEFFDVVTEQAPEINIEVKGA